MPSPLMDPLSRPLERGEVGVSFLSEGGRREIIPEIDLKLLDRTLQPGDFCKRSVDDLRSGVIKKARVRGHVEHVISGEPVEGWKTLEDIRFRRDAEIGDYVVYDDWFGQVIELYDESIIELPTGSLVRLPEFGSRLVVGERAENIIPNHANGVQNLFGFLLGSNRTGGLETVIVVKHTVYAIAWLALNQSLSPEQAQNRARPPRFWHGKDISKLTLVRCHTDAQLRISDRINLKETAGLPYTKHGREGEACGVITVHGFTMAYTETTLDVLWQDGTEESLQAVDVILYLNPDEYDCWPGDHVLWNSEGVKRSAVVQTVDAIQRTATVLFNDTGKIELVSLLELDPHGTSDTDPYAQYNLDGLGVRRGDFVFVHREGSTNGFESPRVPKIGELEAWVRENPFSSGQLTGWRKEMSELGAEIANRRSTDGSEEGHMLQPDEKLDWIGEVSDLLLDGTVKVIHPDGTSKVYPLQRLTKLYDGINQLEDDLYDGSDGESQGSYDEREEWAMSKDGVWRPISSDDRDAWDDEEGQDHDSEEEYNKSISDVLSHSTCPDHEMAPTEEAITPPLPDVNDSHVISSTEAEPSLSNMQSRPPQDSNQVRDPDEDDPSWKRFDILSSAPPDHAYYGTVASQPSKSFLARLNREYRILQSSLPDTILVRTYEDRADLLRCLIIGPQHTPYEDAPFVIDWMLDSNFPHSPPLAHFLSWTNGNGRVNPNLYEEGKVCLSILGTWAGDRNETWSAGRSSLLQAFVSIQGLVLVKEPWFCEPAYEKLRGTEEGIVNSRLYSEKAYVLSRGFVRRALEIPLGGLEEEINWFYYTNHGLEKLLRNSKELIARSRSSVTSSDDDEELEVAIPQLSVGGIITLERTLDKLQGLLDSSKEKTVS
ncbi:hypothetical protein PQX77_008239 [Marasmius sp. AFHP31]|nr:hypothetical protein PQX77_008298 [Marasmius sp. AFHP31]KAK1228745.1 hypothetical protein PQX77_008239 [Marasmius sp. AFHP31]